MALSEGFQRYLGAIGGGGPAGTLAGGLMSGATTYAQQEGERRRKKQEEEEARRIRLEDERRAQEQAGLRFALEQAIASGDRPSISSFGTKLYPGIDFSAVGEAAARKAAGTKADELLTAATLMSTGPDQEAVLKEASRQRDISLGYRSLPEVPSRGVQAAPQPEQARPQESVVIPPSQTAVDTSAAAKTVTEKPPEGLLGYTTGSATGQQGVLSYVRQQHKTAVDRLTKALGGLSSADRPKYGPQIEELIKKWDEWEKISLANNRIDTSSMPQSMVAGVPSLTATLAQARIDKIVAGTKLDRARLDQLPALLGIKKDLATSARITALARKAAAETGQARLALADELVDLNLASSNEKLKLDWNKTSFDTQAKRDEAVAKAYKNADDRVESVFPKDQAKWLTGEKLKDWQNRREAARTRFRIEEVNLLVAKPAANQFRQVTRNARTRPVSVNPVPARPVSPARIVGGTPARNVGAGSARNTGGAAARNTGGAASRHGDVTGTGTGR